MKKRLSLSLSLSLSSSSLLLLLLLLYTCDDIAIFGPIVAVDASDELAVDPLDKFSKKAGWAIAGHNDVHLLDLAVHVCAAECLKHAWCASFDYHTTHKSCSLSSMVSGEAGSAFAQFEDFEYYERDAKEHLAAMSNAGTNLSGHSHNRIHNHDVINWIPKHDKPWKLVVAVLSARHHFSRRDMIRASFMKFTEQYPDVLIRFVVGDKHCAIAPKHRKTSWDCVPKTAGDMDSAFHDLRFVTKERLIDERLHSEAEKHQDIFLMDHVDVYRTLAAKLARYYEFVSKHVKFEFSLKVDDDTWVHVPNIMKTIDTVPKKRLWWSHFRTDWDVHKTIGGKWSEPEYTSLRYPSFGCGGGNIVSSDIAKFIGDAADDLWFYQGEDVSVGIWLAGTRITRKENSNFHVSHCKNSEFTQPEMNPTTFATYWSNYAKCKLICGC